MIAEHLGALLVITMGVAWVAGVASYGAVILTPLREEASAMHAANVALQTGATIVLVGERRWQVKLTRTVIEVTSDDAQFTFTPGNNSD
ncbi:hypothetical protein [Lacticaseibacillus sp. GG6-2]